MIMSKEKTETSAETKFTKEQLLRSRRYGHCRDALEAVLDGQKKYSHADVAKTISDFMKGKVK